MRDHTHAPGWRGRPTRTGPLLGANEKRNAIVSDFADDDNRFMRGCLNGGLITAAIPVGAAVVVWAEPVAAWLARLL